MSLCAGLDRVGSGVRSLDEYVFLSRHLVATGLPMIVFADEMSLVRLQFLNSQSNISSDDDLIVSEDPVIEEMRRRLERLL